MTLGIPEQSVTFEALSDDIGIEQVSLVESDQPIRWEQTRAGLTIDTREVAFKTDLAAAWKVALK